MQVRRHRTNDVTLDRVAPHPVEFHRPTSFRCLLGSRAGAGTRPHPGAGVDDGSQTGGLVRRRRRTSRTMTTWSGGSTPDRPDSADPRHGFVPIGQRDDPGPPDRAQGGGRPANQHNLFHHGQDPGKIDQLKVIEREIVSRFGELLTAIANRRTATNQRRWSSDGSAARVVVSRKQTGGIQLRVVRRGGLPEIDDEFSSATGGHSRVSTTGLPVHCASGRQACRPRCIVLVTATARPAAGSESSRAKQRSMSAIAPPLTGP